MKSISNNVLPHTAGLLCRHYQDRIYHPPSTLLLVHINLQLLSQETPTTLHTRGLLSTTRCQSFSFSPRFFSFLAVQTTAPLACVDSTAGTNPSVLANKSPSSKSLIFDEPLPLQSSPALINDSPAVPFCSTSTPPPPFNRIEGKRMSRRVHLEQRRRTGRIRKNIWVIPFYQRRTRHRFHTSSCHAVPSR